MTIEEAYKQHHDQIMALPDVTGFGIGGKNGTPALVVMVRQFSPELRAQVPKYLEGYPVEVEVSGTIEAF